MTTGCFPGGKAVFRLYRTIATRKTSARTEIERKARIVRAFF